MFHSTVGLVHLLAALLAMLTGATVLLNTKGGLFHRRAGYIYVVLMLLVNATAFGIYRVTGRFSPFHALAIVSLMALLGGVVPALLRPRVRGWIYWHYYFMNWSVVGLYAAFWAETLSRTLPVRQFWPVVVAATTITCIVGSILIRRNARRLLSAQKEPAQTPTSAA